MKCEEVKINLPEYIDQRLDKHTTESVQEHLKSCSSCQAFYTELNAFLKFAGSMPAPETPAGMIDDFMERLDLEGLTEQRNIRTLPFWIKIAASLILATGTFLAGYQLAIKKNEKITSQLTAELDKQKQAVLLASLRDYTGPQKIEAVYTIGNSGQASEELIDALVYTMNSDKNVNVRLAAINALTEMIGKDERIKTELIRSLTVQENPLLQISLIQVLTESGVKEAKEEIESISTDEKTNEQVKAFAKDRIKIIS